MIMPADCSTMAEVREGVDEVDRSIAALLGTRFAFMNAAARIKQDREAVRDEDRKAAVIANARVNARVNGVPEAVAADLWEGLIEASIEYEMAAFERK